MVYDVFSMRDNVAQVFMAPIVERNQASAVRNFQVAMKQRAANGFNPSDFTLLWIGTWDDEDGLFQIGTANVVCHGGFMKEDNDD